MKNKKCHRCQEDEQDIQTELARLRKTQQQLSKVLLDLLETQAGPGNRAIGTTLESHIPAIQRIIGGQPVAEGEFPECCLVGRKNADQSIEWFCTGVLIHPQIVLSAAHCAPHTPNIVALNATDQNRLEQAEKLTVRKIKVHPQYQVAGQPYNDMVALILQTEACTAPVGIATASEMSEAGAVTLVGFGHENAGGSQGFGIKRRVNVDMVSIRRTPQEDLNAAEIKYGFESDLEFVAGGDGFDSCNGDSGGPAYILVQGNRRVAGLTSRATKDATHMCGDGGVYTRLDVQEAFLKEVMDALHSLI